MISGQFEYVRPGNLDETLRILKEREGEAKLLSGGYSLIPLLKLRLAQPACWSTSGTSAARRHHRDRRLPRIGARATHRQIHEDPIVRDHYPIIQDVTARIGDPQVRNWGTIGGSVAHADPASDWPAVLLAANATIVFRGQTASAAIAARDFFLDTFTTAIEPTEVLTEIRDPAPAPRRRRRLQKLERRVGDFATVGVAASSGSATTAASRRRDRGDRRRRAPFAATDAEAVLRRQRAERGPLPPGRRRGRGPEPARRRCPRPGRLQARDGRGDDRQGAPAGRRARPRVRIGGRR